MISDMEGRRTDLIIPVEEGEEEDEYMSKQNIVDSGNLNHYHNGKW